MFAQKVDIVNEIHFSEEIWINILENVDKSYKLTENEYAALRFNSVAKLLAALPFCAGCAQPDQLATLKIGMYLSGMRYPSLFTHRQNQSIRDRLLPGVECPDGDQDVIEIITDFLEIISINDHFMDFQQDIQNSKFNPLEFDTYKYLKRREFLYKRIHLYPDAGLISTLREIADPRMESWWIP